MKRHFFWIPLIMLLLVATGLSAALMRDSSQPADAVATPLQGEKAPNLNVPLLDSQSYLTSDTMRGKPHLLNFFASWCGPCAEENPMLLKLAQKHQVPIIGIALKDESGALNRYLAKRGNPYDMIAMDDSGDTALDWGVTGVPETFAINAQGRIVARTLGGMTEEDAEGMMNSLLHPAK